MSGVDASWCRYFFVYDTSQVTGEDDSTDKGIRYFYPPETDEDEQRLLCSQFPGVARCVTELTCRPPFMVHLRHVKFALRTQGPFFLALGCIPSLPDGCCRHMLDRLLLLFTCYRGPLGMIYQEGSEPPRPSWEPFLDHVQRAVRYLPGLFSTVRYLNKHEVDSLLLLKAALILQSCQRCPHVLAGCILHNLTVVSSQLTPQVTANLLAARAVQRALKQDISQEYNSNGDTGFYQEVSVIPVYLSDEEFSSLHCHAARQLNRFSSTGSDLVSRPCGPDGRPRLSLTLSDTTDTESDDSSSDEGSADSRGTRRRLPGCGALLFQPVFDGGPGSQLGRWKADLTNTVSEFQASEASATAAETPDSVSEAEEATGSPGTRARGLARRDARSGRADSRAVVSPEDVAVETTREGRPPVDEVAAAARSEAGRRPVSDAAPAIAATGGEPSPPSPPRAKSEISPEPRASTSTDGGGVGGGGEPGAAGSSEEGDDGNGEYRTRVASESGSSLRSASLPSFSSSPPSSSEGEEGARARRCPPRAPRGFVRLALYVQAKPEITMVLLAEDALRNDLLAQDDVFTCSLASLNGLDVHLQEAFAQAPSEQRKHGYSFLCYDRVFRSLQGSKRVMALTTPDILRDSHTHGASTPERMLCRAASLMHAEFRHSPAITEITLRSSTACVYGAQTAAQEVFFQASPSQRSSTVGPGFADGAYRLPGIARSKLHQHGIILP